MIRHPGLEPLAALILHLLVVLFLVLQLEARPPAIASPIAPRSSQAAE